MSKLSARTAPRSGNTPLEARILAVLAIVLATTLAAGLTGLIAAGENDEWYQGLNKAPGTPPEHVQLWSAQGMGQRKPNYLTHKKLISLPMIWRPP